MSTTDALLADGTVVQLRPIQPADAAALERFHATLSPETIRRRFFTPHPRLSAAELERFTVVDHRDREALVACIAGEIIGVARYEGLPGTRDAEAAFVVADRWQGSGVGTLLLEHLGARGRDNGLERFVAETLGDNRRMLDVFAHSGLAPTTSWQDGVVHLVMALAPSPASTAALEAREHTSEAHSIQRLLEPRSIAVIGASPRPGTVGHEIVRSLVEGGFTGTVHPVNRRGETVAGIHASSSVEAIEGSVDIAVVAVPSDGVAPAVAECARKSVHGLVVVSGGFAETGPEGAERQREVAMIARRHGMRLIGPNCVGVVNTDPAYSLDATFGAIRPTAGRVALASQSGAVGIAVLNAATRAGIGISSFVSLGNKADISSNDLLQYWEDDPRTAVICLYLESFGNPTKFARLARRVGQSKPIVAVKSGRTPAGRRAASSHTAALASDDTVVDALFRQCGVLRVETIDELLDTALVLADQPLTGGSCLAIIGNSGGPAIMAVDACAGSSVELAELSAATRDRLGSELPAGTITANPVDLLGGAGPSVYAHAIAIVMDDPGVDALMVIYAPTLVSDPEAVASVVTEAAESAAKPLVAVLTGRDRSVLASPRVGGVPVFGSVEPAVAALGRTMDYAAWRRRPVDPVPELAGIDRRRAHEIVAEILRESPAGRWVEPALTDALLRTYGVSLVATEVVHDLRGARAAARRVGYPIALKASGPTLVHKTDVGGVVLGVRGPAALARAWETMTSEVGAAMTDAIVQRMAEHGVETLVGAVRDPTFGPVVVFATGGTAAELIGDRVVRAAPLSRRDARDAIRALRCAPLLTGYRGSTPVDMEALEDVLLRVAFLSAEVSELAELDLNPVIATPSGAIVVDAKLRIAPSPLRGATTRHLAPPRPLPA
jgi:acetyl coenzyme A synthetase (ADP forming)-like protein